MGVIRVVLADDHQGFVEALAMRLRVEPGIEVVAATTSEDQAINVVSAFPADVALLDIELAGGRDGIELGQALQAKQPQLRLVAVTCREDIETVARAMEAGFAGWVPKEARISVLVDVVQAVCRGETWVPGQLLTALLQHILLEKRAQQEGQDILTALTARERDVLRWMASGATRAEIAAELVISPNTVRTHMQSILSKLGVHSSLAAVALARRAGLN